MGAERWIGALDTPEIQAWQKASKQTWKIKSNSSVIGTMQLSDEFFFGIVNVAGHMVPKDQAPSAKDMIDRFIANDKDWSKTS